MVNPGPFFAGWIIGSSGQLAESSRQPSVDKPTGFFSQVDKRAVRLHVQRGGCGAERRRDEGDGDHATVDAQGRQAQTVESAGLGRGRSPSLARSHSTAIRGTRTSYPRGNGNRPAGPQCGASGRTMTELSRTATPTFSRLLSPPEGPGFQTRPGPSFLTPKGGPVHIRVTASSGAARSCSTRVKPPASFHPWGGCTPTRLNCQINGVAAPTFPEIRRSVHRPTGRIVSPRGRLGGHQ